MTVVKGESEADRYGKVTIIHRFGEPSAKLKARGIFMGFTIGALFLLLLFSYLFLREGDLSLALIGIVGAFALGIFMLGQFAGFSKLGTAALAEEGILFYQGFGRRQIDLVLHEDILSVRVPKFAQSVRLFRVTAVDGRQFVVDGWIEHDFIERLRSSLGERWESVFVPRKGRHPIWPPHR